MGYLSPAAPSFGSPPTSVSAFSQTVDAVVWRAAKTDSRTFTFLQGGGSAALTVTWNAAGTGCSSFSANPAVSTFTLPQQAELRGALATMGAPTSGVFGSL